MSILQRFVQLFGLAFLLVTVLGFLSSGLSTEAGMHHASLILGVFPTNLAHNLVHLFFGLWGVLAARRWLSARRYTRVSGALYLLLVPVGILSPTLGGWMPVGGSDVILHATLGAMLGLAGFLADAPEEQGEMVASAA